jgi:hypothetical protein
VRQTASSFQPVAHSLRSAFADYLTIWHLKDFEESPALELRGQRAQVGTFIKAPMICDQHFLDRL